MLPNDDKPTSKDETVDLNLREHESTGATLPWSDLWRLPLVSFCTVLLMVFLSEVGARILWPRAPDACEIADPSGHIKSLPSCRSRSKIPEGPWINNVTNECGFHNRESCGVKPADTIRIATIGSSFTYGYHVDADATYTAQLSRMLSRQCGQPVEFQNLGNPGLAMIDVYRSAGTALRLKPDVLLIGLLDAELRTGDADQLDHLDEPAVAQVAPIAEHHRGMLPPFLQNLKEGSRSLTMLQHFLYEDLETHAKLYLLRGDDAQFVRDPLPVLWQARIERFDTFMSALVAKAQANGTPVVLLIGPDSNQVAVARARPRPGVDPYRMNTLMAGVASRRGAIVIDPLRVVANQPDPLGSYYVIDGHLNARGQTILAQFVDKALLSSKLAALANCKAI